MINEAKREFARRTRLSAGAITAAILLTGAAYVAVGAAVDRRAEKALAQPDAQVESFATIEGAGPASSAVAPQAQRTVTQRSLVTDDRVHASSVSGAEPSPLRR